MGAPDRRRKRGRSRPAPLPPREGVDATRVVLRAGPERTIGQCLRATPSCSGLSDADLAARAAAGEIVDADGVPVGLDTPATLNTSVYLYRDLPDEVMIPFEMPVLYRDENIVVVDKPHFLATMPRGKHVTQTALVRLRRELGSDQIAPAHRLDRLTAGVLLFTLRPQVRAAYQDVFATRRAVKEYRAVGPVPSFTGPQTVANRIEKTAGDLRARVVDGPVNAISEITEIERLAAGSVYRLVPQTGRTHQLRLHMALLGTPIAGDPLYPQVRADLAERPDAGDFSEPLLLLARSLSFTDPLTGQPRHFESQRSLTAP